MSKPAFGLLLDVDGPISNPDEKRIVEPSIVPSIVKLLDAGIAIVLNTGREDQFVNERIFAPILDAKPNRIDRLHAVCEKGGTWFSVTSDGTEKLEIDPDIRIPSALVEQIKKLIANGGHASAMFFDERKYTMVSVERAAQISHDDYVMAQRKFSRELLNLIQQFDLGVNFNGRVFANSKDEARYRLAIELIATDVEMVHVGKDLGASRAYELLKADDALPSEWRTVGDSDGDYAMAQWLTDHGHSVKHIDVRAAENASLPAKFPVLRPESRRFDSAGAAYLGWLVDHVSGSPRPVAEEDFDA